MNMMKNFYRLSLALASTSLIFAVGSAFAHIKNEASQFPDIEFSEARFDIVLLVGAGIIPETPVFEPDAAFSRRDLAAWAALAADLAAGGETPDTQALAAAAVEHGLVPSIDGEATFGDISRVFFEGQVTPNDPDARPSRAEAASFIARHLDTAAGVALLARRGVRQGPSGETARVETRQNPDGHASYVITIGDTSLPMYAHGRVANGPTDLVQWDGRKIRRSFIREQGELAYWTYLEAEPPPEDVGAEAPADGPSSGQEATDRRLMYALVAAAAGLGLVLFFQGRRSA